MTDYATGVMPAIRPHPASSALLLHHHSRGPALFPVLGMPLIEWQARLLNHAGIDRQLLVGNRLPEPMATRLADLAGLRYLGDVYNLPMTLSGTIILLAEGALIDPRAMTALLEAASAPALLVFAGSAPPGAERLDRDTHWAGAALLPASMVAETATELGDWDLAATLIRVADSAGAARVAMESIDPAIFLDDEQRTPPPLIWALPTDLAQVASISQDLLASSVPDGPDWTERLLYRPIARLMAPSLVHAIMPPIIWRWLAVAMLLASGILLWWHQFWPGLAILLLAPLPDQLGWMLMTARWQPTPKHLPAKPGPFLLLASLALIGLALSLAGLGAPAAPLIAGAGILLFTGLRVTRLSWLHRVTGRHLDQFSARDRQIAGLFGPVTSLALPLLPFAIMGLWWHGLLAVLIWSALLFILLEWRFLAAIGPSLDRNGARDDGTPPLSRP